MGERPDLPSDTQGPTATTAGPAGSRSARTFAAGAAVIAGQLDTAPTTPGVYRMINGAGDVLYVGKAKNVRKRITSYVKPARLTLRTRHMVAETAAMEFLTTQTEAEALLLESNLIKRFLPRYNILLRDDKSFPSILLTGDHRFAQVVKHRGARSRAGDYFGPFASAWAVNETLAVLQRAFLLRSCSDAVFENRTRPCLLYQIKRCSAPCVGRIGETDYRRLVDEARSFLTGHSHAIQRDLAQRMEEASRALRFEEAAQFRDRIHALSRVQSHQDIQPQGLADADIVAAHQSGGQTCVQVFFVRAGHNYGNRAYYPSHARDEDAAQVLEAFLGQFYASVQPPATILLSHRLRHHGLVSEALAIRAGRKVNLQSPRRGPKRDVLAHALVNARQALSRRLSEGASQRDLLERLCRVLDLDSPPERIEVYDNSHLVGRQPVGVMVVAGPAGPIKGAYRKFTIGGGAARRLVGETATTPGDDYAMVREVLLRRFARALDEDPDRTRGTWPDLVLIDGGLGQLNTALKVFQELGIEDIPAAAIAKGRDRNAGHERIHRPGRPPIDLEPRDPVLFFLQRLRDEAHRFAIAAHRGRRAKGVTRSVLDEVPGIGARRKKALLQRFGSAAAVAQAGPADLASIPGISRMIAKRVYEWFHREG